MKDRKFDPIEEQILSDLKKQMLKDLEKKQIKQSEFKNLSLDWTQKDGLIETFTYRVSLEDREIFFKINRQGTFETFELGSNEV